MGSTTKRKAQEPKLPKGKQVIKQTKVPSWTTWWVLFNFIYSSIVEMWTQTWSSNFIITTFSFIYSYCGKKSLSQLYLTLSFANDLRIKPQSAPRIKEPYNQTWSYLWLYNMNLETLFQIIMRNLFLEYLSQNFKIWIHSMPFWRSLKFDRHS